MDTYWSYLQISLGTILSATAISFAFPRFRSAAVVVVIAVLALSALAPGMPVWLRIGCLVVALGVATGSFLRRPTESSPEPDA